MASSSLPNSDPKICEWCSCEFDVLAARQKNKRFCTNSCAAKHRHRQRVQAGTYVSPGGKKPRTGDQAECAVCGQSFYRLPYQIRDNRKFCSTKCKDESQRKEPVVKSCHYCEVEMRLLPSQSSTRFCSKSCEMLARTKRPLERLHNGKPARLTAHGYVMVYEPDHPNKSHKGWNYEHRILVEKVLGRHLTKDEDVHHLNGVKDDNRIENLQVLDHREHSAITVSEYRESIQKIRDELAEYKRRFGELV